MHVCQTYSAAYIVVRRHSAARKLCRSLIVCAAFLLIFEHGKYDGISFQLSYDIRGYTNEMQLS